LDARASRSAGEEMAMVPKFETILMPTDFSPPSDHALEYGVALARQAGATIHLVHVVAHPIEIAAWPETYYAEYAGLRQQLHEDAERQLAARVKSIAGVKVITGVLDGSPARAIVAAARDSRCQLIVMGTHGRGGFSHLVLGSVAERVVRTAPCPVLTVPAASTAAEKSAASSTG
jgi:nucleotide-binding universal stress UspA family protein